MGAMKALLTESEDRLATVLNASEYAWLYAVLVSESRTGQTARYRLFAVAPNHTPDSTHTPALTDVTRDVLAMLGTYTDEKTPSIKIDRYRNQPDCYTLTMIIRMHTDPKRFNRANVRII